MAVANCCVRRCGSTVSLEGPTLPRFATDSPNVLVSLRIALWTQRTPLTGPFISGAATAVAMCGTPSPEAILGPLTFYTNGVRPDRHYGDGITGSNAKRRRGS